MTEVSMMTATDVAARCHAAAAEIQRELTGLKRYVLALEAPPAGVARPQFDALMAGYDIYAFMLNDVLTGIAAGLHSDRVVVDLADA